MSVSRALCRISRKVRAAYGAVDAEWDFRIYGFRRASSVFLLRFVPALHRPRLRGHRRFLDFSLSRTPVPRLVETTQ